MMKQSAQLVNAIDLAMQQTVAKLSQLAALEQKLRHEIDVLIDQQNNGRAAPTNARALGADIAWSGLVGKRIAAKNHQLALVLAEKAQHQTRAQRAFGRHLAAKSLHMKAKSDIQNAKKKAQLELLQALDCARHVPAKRN